jgi:hypothetical protein
VWSSDHSPPSGAKLQTHRAIPPHCHISIYGATFK